MERDPIGLWGGINPFVYVQNNPANYIDSVGLITENWFDKEKDPTFWALAEEAKKKDKSTNVLTIEAHGRNNSVAKMDINQLIAAIDELERKGIYKKGMTIKLNSCRSAEGDNSIAQQLAQRKQIYVIGSERPVLGDGETYYGIEVRKRWVPGQIPGFRAPWSIFSPSGKRDRLN